MPYAISSDGLAAFQQGLIGTWTNDDPSLLHEGKPLSFNVMPLPQVTPQPNRPQTGRYGGFILKNFSFTETIRFNGTSAASDPPDLKDPQAAAVAAGAPNRGGTYTQLASALFYEQQVRFAEGPQTGKIVHVENGAWLHLGSQAQTVGPYDPPQGTTPDGQVLKQPPQLTIAKQIAVPHGNSVLALGSVDLNDQGQYKSSDSGLTANTVLTGAPVIPDAYVPYPESAHIATSPFFDPYATLLADHEDFENPDVARTLNPSYPLQVAVELIKPAVHMHWRVTTMPLLGGRGRVTNIPFEQRKAKVIEYLADYWLLSTDPGAKEPGLFDYLLYSQTVLMRMEVSVNEGGATREYIFPHITCNTVKKVAGTPSEARKNTETPLE